MKLPIGNILRKFLKSINRGKIQKRLGYREDARLLIIHADDLGFSFSENKASIAAMENGMINSGSVMVPCSGFKEIADYSKVHPDADIGVHLTVLSEWDSVKWKPVLPAESVPSLVTPEGYFMESKEQLLTRSDPAEIENEYIAQIEMAIDSGIDPTHIDSHMYSAFSNREILKRYIAIGKRYRMPVLLTYNLPILSWAFRNDLVLIDNLIYARPADFKKGLPEFYRSVLKSLDPGLNCLLIHPAIKDEDLMSITRDRISHGADWRQADYDFFINGECRKIISENNIRLITWREIRDKLFR